MLKALNTISQLERFLNFKRRNSSEARVRCCAASPTRRTSAAKNGFAGYHLLAVQLTPAEEHARAQVDLLCAAVQQATGHTVELAWPDRSSPERKRERPQRNMTSHCRS